MTCEHRIKLISVASLWLRVNGEEPCGRGAGKEPYNEFTAARFRYNEIILAYR